MSLVEREVFKVEEYVCFYKEVWYGMEYLGIMSSLVWLKFGVGKGGKV